MQSAWRVACVRIPRFPIGAVWAEARAAGAAAAAEQLTLELGATPAAQRTVRAGRTAARDDVGEAGAANGAGGRRNGGAPGDAAGDRGDRGGAPAPDLHGAHDMPDARRQTPDVVHWDDLPLAILDGLRLRAVTAAAGRLRVRAGMTATEARARCAQLEVVAWSEPAVEREVVRATAALLVASPQVTPVAGAPGLWWVGAGGMEGVGGERGLVRTLLRIARLWHPRPRVAVADSCVAARAATWADHDGAPAFIVPRGGCAAYLAPAPLALVPMEDELRQTLHALGLRTAGAFAALEAPDVERRWGVVGLQAWRLARGEDRRRPVLAHPDADRAAGAELATPVTSVEPILFLVRAALDRLVVGLVAEGRAAAALTLTLTLDDGRGALPAGGVAHTVTREIRLPRPLARVAPLFERCRALLDRWPLSAPVCGVMVVIVATAPAPAEQGELLAAGWRDPAAADAALERLRAELGPNVVVRPVARDAHAPERAGAWVEVDDVDGVGRAGTAGIAGAAGGDGVGRAAGAVTVAPVVAAELAVGGDAVAPRRVARGAPPESHDRADAAGTPHPSTGARVIPLRPGVAHLDASRADAAPHADAALRAPSSVPVPMPSSSPASTDDDAELPPPDLAAAALRLLERPEAVDVEWRDGTPHAMWWRGRCVPVAHAAGPERLAGDWWVDPYRRDYWRCASDEGEFLLFRDHLDPADAAARWYLQGWYD